MAHSLYYNDPRAVCDTQGFVHHESSLVGAGGELNVPDDALASCANRFDNPPEEAQFLAMLEEICREIDGDTITAPC